MAKLADVAKAVEAKAAHKLARGSVDRPLPIFDGMYAARFRVVEPERLAEFEALGERDYTPEEAMEAGAEFLGDACRVILAKNGSGKWETLDHADGRPVRFDEDFAEALGLEPPPGREKLTSSADVVLSCWTVEEADGTKTINGAGLNGYAIELLRWMQDTRRKVEGEVTGG